MAGLFRKILEPFGRLSKEEELSAAIIERIRLHSEDELHIWGVKTDAEWEYSRLLRRLRPVLDDSGFSPADLLRWYDKEVYAIVVRPNSSPSKGERDYLQSSLTRAGLVGLPDGSWALTPDKTPQNLKPGELHSWASVALPAEISSTCFIELVDLGLVPPDGSPASSARDSILSVLHSDEVIPAGYLHRFLVRGGLTVEKMVRRGDIVFLASSFSDQETLINLEKSKGELTGRILLLAGVDTPSLDMWANLFEDDVAEVLEGSVSHAKHFAQRLKLEATYWLRILDQIGL